MVPKMRNTHVLLRLIERTERTVGVIVIPTGKDQFTEAEVVSVGPGMVQAAGGMSETHDLKAGQVVYIKHKTEGRNQHGQPCLHDTGIPYNDGQRKLFVFGEGAIMAILAETVEEREQQLAALADQERTDDAPTIAVPSRKVLLPN